MPAIPSTGRAICSEWAGALRLDAPGGGPLRAFEVEIRSGAAPPTTELYAGRGLTRARLDAHLRDAVAGTGDRFAILGDDPSPRFAESEEVFASDS